MHSSSTYDMETVSDLQSISIQFPLLLVHQITSSDLENYSKHKQAYAIAWYGKPLTHTNEPYIRVLKTYPQKIITMVPLKHEIAQNSDLNLKIIQLQTITSIKNSDLTTIPQWFQCCKCNKWRVNRIEKKYFPFTNQPPNWSCNMSNIQTICSHPQSQPKHPQYSPLELHALQIQRQLRQEARCDFASDWIKLSHNILDRLIRRFDSYLLPFVHPLFNQFYYEQNTNAMHITKIKYLLENGSITSFTQFANQLFKIWHEFRTFYKHSDPLHQRAIHLCQKSINIIQNAKIPQQIKEIIIRQITSQTTVQNTLITQQNILNVIQTNDTMPMIGNNNNNNCSEPEIHIRPEHQVLIEDPLPPLEHDTEVINIMSDSEENNINESNNKNNINNTNVNDIISTVLIHGNNENNNENNNQIMDVDHDDGKNDRESKQNESLSFHQKTRVSIEKYKNLCNSYDKNNNNNSNNNNNKSPELIDKNNNNNDKSAEHKLSTPENLKISITQNLRTIHNIDNINNSNTNRSNGNSDSENEKSKSTLPLINLCDININTNNSNTNINNTSNAYNVIRIRPPTFATDSTSDEPTIENKQDKDAMDVVEEESTSSSDIQKRTRSKNKTNKFQFISSQMKDISLPLRYLKLHISTKPKNIKIVKKFEKVLVSSSIAEKFKIIIKQMRTHDLEGHFFKDVTQEKYTEIIKNPIHFGIIINKLNTNKYITINDILCDFNLLWSNCYIYNGKPNADNNEKFGFSNWASDMEQILNYYISQLRQQLSLRGYIHDKNGNYNEINRICHNLYLGPVSTNRMYTFNSRLEIYREIESHFTNFNVSKFKIFLNGKNSNYCRDMKNGMNTKGPIVPTKEMRRTIIERFEELKQCIANGKTLTRRIRKRRQKHKNDNLELSRRSSLSVKRIISDSDSDSEIDVGEMMSNLHSYPMRGPFINNNFTWCCDNNKCLYCPVGVYKKHSMPLWISTKMGDSFYLCDGCMIPKKYPIIKYIMDLDDNKIRYGLDCPYPQCNSPLQCFVYGVHDNCRAMKVNVRCNYCNNKNLLLYYHCIDGCLNYKNINGHQIYVCKNCAEKYCNSVQRYSHNNMLAFYGVWTYFNWIKNKYEIIIMLQEANRISFRLLCGDNDNKIYNGTMQEDEYIDDVNKIIVKMDDNKNENGNGKYKHIIWKYKNDMNITLEIFMNDEANQIKLYHKILPKCNKCKSDMLFLYRNIFPNNNKNNNKNNMKCCGNLEQYDYMKYLTLKSINYAFFHEYIHKNDFYFYCNQCDYGICQGCVLIKHEIEMNKKNIIIKKKNEILNNNNNNNNNNLISNEDLVKQLLNKIKVVETERDYWKQQSKVNGEDRDYGHEKHGRLYKAMQSILDHENNE